ncbi:MAG TPA: hypothetical protein PLU17_13280, partial [Chitinophagaceae bacterium]|nr:hypothetical protein [Chitinophagaceae bacterium]
IRSINKLSYKTYSSAQFEFLIEPPFWQTWWFRILLSILAIVSLYLLIKRRDIIKEKEAKLNMQMSELKLTAL